MKTFLLIHWTRFLVWAAGRLGFVLVEQTAAESVSDTLAASLAYVERSGALTHPKRIKARLRLLLALGGASGELERGRVA